MMTTDAEAKEYQYTDYNSDLLDRFAEREVIKQQAQRAGIRGAIQRHSLLYLAGLAIATGLFLVLAAWAWSIFMQPKIIEVEKTVIVEKFRDFSPTITLQSKDASTLPDPSGVLQGIGNSISKNGETNDNGSSENAQLQTRNYVVFDSYELGEAGFHDVQVGRTYDPEDISMPISEFCYVTETSYTDAAMRYNLAFKVRGQDTEFVDFTNSSGGNMNRRVFEKAQSLCMFMS